MLKRVVEYVQRMLVGQRAVVNLVYDERHNIDMRLNGSYCITVAHALIAAYTAYFSAASASGKSWVGSRSTTEGYRKLRESDGGSTNWNNISRMADVSGSLTVEPSMAVWSGADKLPLVALRYLECSLNKTPSDDSRMMSEVGSSTK